MHTNFFLIQQEYVGIILLNKRITITSLKQHKERLSTKDLIKGIRNKKGY